ncbi:MAG: B12-binding domain-containing radical SAM protein [bacterium]|jgi:radical SAM superfamily enzyme YgiQ (UPF0313 family)
MKILLVYPPWIRFFGGSQPTFLLGLGYIAAVLESNGYEVAIYNADFDKSLYQLKNIDFFLNYSGYCNSVKDINNNIYKEINVNIEKIGADIIFITALSANIDSAIAVAAIAKKINRKTIIVMGGPHPTALPEDVLEHEDVDIVVRGEGETTSLDLVNCIADYGPTYKNYLEFIDGISYKKDGRIFHNQARKQINNLDSIPFPARHLLINGVLYPPSAYSLIFSSRGCPYNCIFCASKISWTRKIRYRSPQNVLDEIRQVKEKYNCKNFRFQDDTLTVNRDYLMELCNLMIQNKLNITWSCLARVDEMDKGMAKLMREAGCTTVSLGIETGSKFSMKMIKKNINLDSVKNVISVYKKSGIITKGFFIYGFPWEDKNMIMDSLNFILKLKLDAIEASVALPLPGTELYEMVKKTGILPEKIKWGHMNTAMPDSLFSLLVEKGEAKKIINYTQISVERYNNQRYYLNVFKKVTEHPFIYGGRFFKEKYYSKILNSLFKKLLFGRR